MTAPVYIDERDSSLFEIFKGNADGPPETFTLQCVANTSKDLERKANAIAAVVPRKDDPTKPGKTIRTANSTDTTLSFAGVFDGATGLAWWNAVGTTSNYKIQAGGTAGDLLVSGPFILESFKITGGELGKEVTATFTLSQADDVAAAAHG